MLTSSFGAHRQFGNQVKYPCVKSGRTVRDTRHAENIVMKRHRIIKLLVPLVAIAGLFILIPIVQSRMAAPGEFRGILRYPMMNIGGEGSEAKLVTQHGAYDLYFTPNRGGDGSLRALNGKRVVVVGHPRVMHGIERHAFAAIDVVNLTPD